MDTIGRRLLFCGFALFVFSSYAPETTTPPIAEQRSGENAETTDTDAPAISDEVPADSSTGSATSKADEIGPRQTRVEVGEKAPTFRLVDQNGQQHVLEDLLKKGKVALVFFRSADW